MASEWLYKSGGKELGPVSPSRIRELVTNGDITPATELRKSDSPKWLKASQIKGLFPDPDEQIPDPLLAMGSQAAHAVADAAGSAVKAVGGWFAKKDTSGIEPPDMEARIRAKLTGILTADEVVEIIAIQARPVINWVPDCICLTNKRFIFYRPKLLGRIDFEDYIWRDLRDAKVTENIIGATFSISTTAGGTLTMDYLPRDQAKAVYRFAQDKEQIALEERRQRVLEEQRSKAGGVVVNMGQQPAQVAADDPMAKLQKLKSMADAGLITVAEFEAKKADLLSRM